MTTARPSVGSEPPQLALWPGLAIDQRAALKKPAAPNFPGLASLRAHLRDAGAADWADNSTLTQSASRRLAVIRPTDDYGWLLIAPGPALYLHVVSRCASRKQALALCAAIEDRIDLPWDQPATGQQLGAWRSADGEGLWGAIVRMRGADPALDDSAGLYAGIMATHSTADDRQKTAEPDANAEHADEPASPAPAVDPGDASPFSRSWGYFLDTADLRPQPQPRPSLPEGHLGRGAPTPFTAEFRAAVQLLESLRIGDRVRVTSLGIEPPTVREATVSRQAWRDGGYESTQVKVTYGPGRYAFNLAAAAMAPMTKGLVLPGQGQTVEVISRAEPAPANAVKNFVARNAHEGWRLDELDGRAVAKRRPTASYRDYPEPWYGYIWPVDEGDPCGDWAYEVRAIRARGSLVPEIDPVILDRGAGKLHEVFRYITDKR